MPVHDSYGKKVLQKASGYFDSNSRKIWVKFGNGGFGRIDVVIGETITVEIESRVDKQIRGALIDLIMHPFPKNFLLFFLFTCQIL